MKCSGPQKEKTPKLAGSVKMKLRQGQLLNQGTSNYKNGSFIFKWKELV